MAFTKITDADLQGKGVVGQAPVPGLPVKEMQESVEQIVREVAIPGINRLADELSAQTAAKNIGMQVPDGMPGGASANVSSVVGTHVLSTGNPHKVTAEQVGAYTKEQTDQAINQKVQDIGAGDMSKSEYARTGTYGAVDRALSADRAVQSDDGVKVYTHTKSGTVHNFAGTGANGRAKLTADVQAGDTFTVNGAPVAAYVGADSAADAMAGSPWNGRWVSFTVEGGTLNFKGGGGKVTVTGLAAGAVKKGTTVTVKQGAKVVSSVEGTLTWQDLLPERNVGQSGATINAEFLGGLSNTSQGSINGNGITPGSSGNVAFCFTKAIDTNIYQAVEFKIGTVRYAVESSTIKVGLSGSVNINYDSFTVVKQFTGVFKIGNVYRCDFSPGTSGYVKLANWNADLFVVETTLIKRQ